MSKDKKSKIKMTEGKRICSVGGQALMEGIMMLGPKGMAQVVRNPKGELVIKKEKITPLVKKYKFFGLPLIRGSIALFDSLRRGVKALYDSAEIAIDEDDENYESSKFDTWVENKLGDKAMTVLMAISMIIAVVFSVGLFFILPTFISSFIPQSVPRVVYSLCEGLVRLAIFMTYMIIIAKMKDIKRVYMYHGAEHKTIHCFEHEDELTVENVRKYSKHHPRCGTAFLFVVMIISILIYSLLPRFDTIWFRIGSRLLLLPVIAGISYEFNRIAGKYTNKVTKILRAPGMAMQRFTTVEPEDDMIEVAIVALNEALSFENEENPEIKTYSALDRNNMPKDDDNCCYCCDCSSNEKENKENSTCDQSNDSFESDENSNSEAL